MKDDLIWRPFTSLGEKRNPLKISYARGLYLITEDGRKIADLNSSWWVNLHGHSHPDIHAAIQMQLQKFGHVMFSDCTHEAAEEFCILLKKKLPVHYSKIFFSDNGSTSVEVALKMAVQYFYLKKEKRFRFLALEGGYHGDTFGSMSVAERNIFTVPFTSLLFDVCYVPCPENSKISSVLDKIETEHRKNPFIAFVYEPLVQGAAGMRMYEDIYLDIVLRKCRELGILLIADEVMTGFGRTGTFLASEQMKEWPDFICLSKGVTGGYLPLGITVVSERIAAVFRNPSPDYTFYHGHSYTGYALACAAAVANMRIFEKENSLQKVWQIEQWYKEISYEIPLQKVHNIRIKGDIFAMDIISDENDKSGYLNPLKGKIFDFFLEHDMLIRPLGNTFYLIPPYCITREEIKKSVEVLKKFLTTLDSDQK